MDVVLRTRCNMQFIGLPRITMKHDMQRMHVKKNHELVSNMNFIIMTSNDRNYYD